MKIYDWLITFFSPTLSTGISTGMGIVVGESLIHFFKYRNISPARDAGTNAATDRIP
jgi:hypothetical protein